MPDVALDTAPETSIINRRGKAETPPPKQAQAKEANRVTKSSFE